MRANIEKAHQAMLEGDRDEVVRLLADSTETDEVIWLRAQAAVSDEERTEYLNHLMTLGDSEYSELARKIIVRENEFTEQLSEPPDYKFWVRSTWNERLRKLHAVRFWIIGGMTLMLCSFLGLVLNNSYRAEQELAIEGIKATQTAVSLQNQAVSSYTAGTLQIVDIDFPTSKDITFGEAVGNQPLVAAPATGSQFAAIRMRFTCHMALCPNPPEAELRLLLADGQVVSYGGGSRPVVIGQTPMSRVAQGESTTGWLVFEVPNNSMPEAILVITGEDEMPQRIKWRVP